MRGQDLSKPVWRPSFPLSLRERAGVRGNYERLKHAEAPHYFPTTATGCVVGPAGIVVGGADTGLANKSVPNRWR